MPRFAKVSNTFWQPCTEGGVPYGWPSQWGDFNYKFYAITEDGFLGCKEITKDGYCIEDENTPGKWRQTNLNAMYHDTFNTLVP